MNRFNAAILLCLLLLSGCALSPEQRRQVEALSVAQRSAALSCAASVDNACAISSPLLQQARRDRASGQQHVSLLVTGEEALALRLHLIRAATRRIDVQYFIIANDHSGHWLLQELLAAAKRGVKVRILFDQLFSVSEIPFLSQLALAHVNLELRVYNPTFNQANTSAGEFVSGIACCFRRFNQRMHNKLLLVDDVVGITGGRNLADRYFDFDPQYNFKDLDVMASGRVVDEMKKSFSWFWDSQVTTPLAQLSDVARQLLQGEAAPVEPFAVPGRFAAVHQQAQDSDYIRRRWVDSAWPAEQVYFFSDIPRKPFARGEDQRQGITRQLHDILSSARRSVIIQSPYLVLSRKARKVFRYLRRQRPQLEMVFSTNSLASTDAYPAYALSHKHKKRYVKKLGFSIYELKPYPEDRQQFIPRYPELVREKARGLDSGPFLAAEESPTLDRPGPRTGIHGKAFVIDSRVALIGSHNFDPRSEGFNTENGLLVVDTAFAAYLESLIRQDIQPQNSWVVAAKPKKVPLISDIGGVIEDVSRSLPVFDLWPFHYTSAYELIPGMEAVSQSHPDFYRNYKAVGPFPEVTLTKRQIKTRIIGSFFGFLAPIM